MRLTAFLLALLVLILSCLPCADADACARQDNACTGATCSPSAGDPAKEQAHHTECCSPFCQCACCAAIGLPQSFQVRLETWTGHAALCYAPGRPSSLRAISLPVWQPPRL